MRGRGFNGGSNGTCKRARRQVARLGLTGLRGSTRVVVGGLHLLLSVPDEAFDHQQAVGLSALLQPTALLSELERLLQPRVPVAGSERR